MTTTRGRPLKSSTWVGGIGCAASDPPQPNTKNNDNSAFLPIGPGAKPKSAFKREHIPIGNIERLVLLAEVYQLTCCHDLISTAVSHNLIGHSEHDESYVTSTFFRRPTALR